MEKGINILAFIPVIVWILYPHMVARADFSSQNQGVTAQVFEVKGQIPNPAKEDQTMLAGVSESKLARAPQVPSLAYADLAARDLNFQTKIAYKDSLRAYLESRRSPFVPCVDTLVELKNADKILSLANAESGLGLRTIPGTYNYWGVGGSKLWKMGSNPCEGIVSMDNFLNAYPRNSSVKYAEMPLSRMNGLYKQPARQHWIDNNMYILTRLHTMWNQSSKIAMEKINTPDHTVRTAVTGDIELVLK